MLEAAVAWPALERWRRPRRLAELAGARTVPVEVGAGRLGGVSRAQQVLCTLGDYLDAVCMLARGEAPGGAVGEPVAVSEVVPVTSARTVAYLAQHPLLEQ